MTGTTCRRRRRRLQRTAPTARQTPAAWVRGQGLRGLCLVLVMLAVAACGVRSQDAPVPLRVDTPALAPSSQPTEDGFFVTVYFVWRGQLFPVTRRAPDASTASALAVLAAGPDEAEAARGLETAITPQVLVVGPATRDAVTVLTSPQFTSISGDDQLLAAAQLVWTVTANASSDEVQIAVDDVTVEIPTDRGLSSRPVRRSDYLSVAPLVEATAVVELPTGRPS